ncbi:hypothetical protein Plhal304r1_c010g0040701 [Plasmopara halstedii]
MKEVSNAMECRSGSEIDGPSIANDTLSSHEDVHDLDGESPTKPIDPLLQKELDDGVVPHNLSLHVEMLRGKLSRRNQILEVIRRAYYRDVIVIKEELRQKESTISLHGNSVKLQQALSSQNRAAIDGGLSSVPSVDLRDVLPLFAPSETMLQVHPCETCGGHLELVHGETKELQAARREKVHAMKKEQEMRATVQRQLSEARQLEEVNEALQQRMKALTKENAFTLEQLQVARRKEREQKIITTDLRSKLQLIQGMQEKIDRLTDENNNMKRQLSQSNEDREILSAFSDRLNEQLAQVTEALQCFEVEKARVESELSTTYIRLQEEIITSEQRAVDLAVRDGQLREKTTLCAEQQQTLVFSKEELVSSLQRFDQTKRHLEDQLIEEERIREETQEQNLELRRQNKKLLRDLETIQGRLAGLEKSPVSIDANIHSESDCNAASQTASMREILLKKLEGLEYRLECALMRENDLAGHLAYRNNGECKPLSQKHALSTSRIKTVITRQLRPERDILQPAEASAVRTILQKPTLRDINTSNKQNTVIATAEPVLKEEDESQESLNINEKDFETYHKEIARMLMEINEGKVLSAKQQKMISELERKNRVLSDRLENSQLSIEALTSSVNTMKLRQNQDSAGVTEMKEVMARQVEEGKRDQLYEAEKSSILVTFMRRVSESVHGISDNKALLFELDLDAVPPDNPQEVKLDISGGIQTMELQRKKREVHRKMLLEKTMRKFSILCHNRAELIEVELQKLKANLERMHENLDQAENRIDSDQLHIRILEAETSKLRIVVENTKSDSGKLERSLKHMVDELNEYTKTFQKQADELTMVKGNHEKLVENQVKLMNQLLEKNEAWNIEIATNKQLKKIIDMLEAAISDGDQERRALQQKLNQIEELAEFRRRTNRSVEVSVISETINSGIQTDRWKPQGLILRQRNGSDRVPQRYLGKASVMIAYPELNQPFSSEMDSVLNLTNREFGALSSQDRITTESDPGGSVRGLFELNVYPSDKVGGRQIKTSYSSSRPKALSRLYLSSDGVSEKYIAPAQGPQQRVSFDGRPSTVL